jgi:hypothetical protein
MRCGRWLPFFIRQAAQKLRELREDGRAALAEVI